MRATVKPLEKGFMLMLGEHELGFSKTDSDARFHMHAINAALDAAQPEDHGGKEYLQATGLKPATEQSLKEYWDREYQKQEMPK